MILFRADGNHSLGVGHIMRCLSIADAFREIGEEVVFVVADDSMSGLISLRGYRAIPLDTNYSDMAGELKRMLMRVDEVSPQLIVVDSYYVTAQYLSALKMRSPIAYIDDVMAFAYPVDFLINYNVYADKTAYEQLYADNNLIPPEFLLGTTYAPLRKQFKTLPPKIISEKCSDIFISTGGADPAHLALRYAKYIVAHDCGNSIKYHILVGAMNPDLVAIEDIAADCDNILVHSNVSDMKSLICSCDFAISAAGSTLYEICACGVPLITYVMADNQIPGAMAFASNGLALYCGDIRDGDICPAVFRAVEQLASDCGKRQSLSRKMQRLIDGNGAERMAHQLLRL